MSIAKIDACVETVVGYLVRNEKRSSHLPKKYTDIQKVVEAAASQIIGNIAMFVKYWCLEEVGVEGDGLSSSRWREAIKEIPRTATRVWML